MCADTTNRLPAIFDDDDDGDFSPGLVKGTRLKFVDKVWTAVDGTPLHEDDQFLMVGTGFDYQRWVDKRPAVYGERPLPNLDVLNESVPKEEWPIGKFSGKREGPWKRVWCIYLVRSADSGLFTSINTTAGQRVAYVKIKEKIKTKAMLNGGKIAMPTVRLSWAMMPTADFGPRPRPDFVVVADKWRDHIEPEPKQVEGPKPTPAPSEKIDSPIAPVTPEEALDDAIPF
jgi:hypothetical protein